MSDSAVPLPILIILPTYNEAENIGELVPEILSASAEFDAHVLVVDDNSSDGTGEIVRRLGEADPRVRLLSRPGKLGLGTAYLAGYDYALANDYALAVTMDADFSHAPAHLPAILRAATNADLVIGSRYIRGGGISNWPLWRKVLSAGANLLARTIIGIRGRDCTSGYRAYRRALLERLRQTEITSDGYSFLIEALSVCERAGARVAESPIHFVDRRGGVSKISKKEIYKAFGTLWRVFWAKHRRPS